MSRARRALGLMSAVLVLCAPWLAAHSPQAAPAQDTGVKAGSARPATHIPTHVLTKYKAGSVTAAEQGDFIEVRLDEPAPTQGIWQMSSQTGYARIQALGETALVQDATGTKRVFRFQALGIGELELAFAFHAPPQAPKPQQVLTFRLVIK